VGRGPAAQTAPAADHVAGGESLRARRARRAGIASIAAYLLAIAGFEIARRTWGFPEPSDFALTPAALAAGRVWLLLSSALLVSGPPLLELAGLTLAVVVLVRRESPAAFWRAAVGGHVAGTVVVYGGIGLLWLAARSTVADLVHVRDYGVSSVWLGVLGAILASLMGAAERRPLGGLERVWLASSAIAGVVGMALFGALTAAEHGFAFAIGAGLQWHSQRGQD
jgi:hypothetical protein